MFNGLYVYKKAIVAKLQYRAVQFKRKEGSGFFRKISGRKGL
jgi:hypothetical protein